MKAKKIIVMCLLVCLLASTAIARAADTRTFIDGDGQVITVPVDVKRIMGYATPLLVDLCESERIVALSSDKSPSIYDYTAAAYQQIGYQKSISHDDNNTLESIAQLQPDIYFCRRRSADTMREGLSALGIPMAVFDHETPEEYFGALRMVARCIGQEESAERVIECYTSQLTKIRARTEHASRPTAVLLGSRPTKVAHGGMLQSVMMEAAGLENVAQGMEVAQGIWPEVGLEAIFAWNPEYIFVTGWGTAQLSAEALIADPAWQSLRAVKAGHVYTLPCALDPWEYPDACSVLLSAWLASIAHPELYKDSEMEADVLAYYHDIYGESCAALTREVLGF